MLQKGERGLRYYVQDTHTGLREILDVEVDRNANLRNLQIFDETLEECHEMLRFSDIAWNGLL